MQNKIKVIQISDSLCQGGRENIIIQLSNYLDKQSFSLYILSLDDNQDLKKDINRDIPVWILAYKTKEISGIRLLVNSFSFIRKLLKVFSDIRPDIIHVHSFFFIYFLITLAAYIYDSKVPIVRTVHTSGLFYSSNKIIDKIRLSIEKFAQYFNPVYLIAVSERIYSNNKLLFKKAKKQFLIHNGINLSKFDLPMNNAKRKQLRLQDNDIVCVYVARFDYGKNQDWLVRLWKAFVGTNIKLMLVGDGILFSEVQRIVNEDNLSENIVLTGASNEIPQILRNSDIALFPSSYEGFSVSLIEKMASALPLIVSDIPAFREVISDEKDGFIISLNKPDDWILTIRVLANDYDLRKRIGKSAKNKSKNFSIERMVAMYEDVYLNAIKN